MWDFEQVKIHGAKGEGPGRFVTAAVDLPEGTIVLREKPFLFAPKQSSCLVCVECCAVLKRVAGCPECGLPLCKHCIDIKISSGTSSNTNTNTDIGTNKKKCLVWHEAECRLLKNNSVRVSLEEKDEKEASKVLSLVSPLRLLLLPDDDWKQLESHVQAREDTPIFIYNSRYVTPLIINLKKANGEEISEGDVHLATGTLDTNTFEVKMTGVNDEVLSIGRALYPQAALLNNNCQPNLAKSFSSSAEISFVTSRSVNAGEELTICYTSLMQPTATRQAMFRQTKHFKCACKRCLDPSELGSFVASIKCSECEGQVVDVEGTGSNWQCSKCNEAVEKERVDQVEEMIGSLVSRLEPSTDCIVWRSALGKIRRLLSSHHHLLTRAKKNLLKHAERCEDCAGGEEVVLCREELRQVAELLGEEKRDGTCRVMTIGDEVIKETLKSKLSNMQLSKTAVEFLTN